MKHSDHTGSDGDGHFSTQGRETHSGDSPEQEIPDMKRALITAATMLMLLVGPVVPPAEAATCYGHNPCNACKNCKYCKHCAKDGGTCKRVG